LPLSGKLFTTCDEGWNPGAPLPEGVLVAPEWKVVATVECLAPVIAGEHCK
jgi:hypothetical protein